MSDGTEIRDATGLSIQTESICGLDRARARVKNFDEQDIAWQVEVIRHNTSSISKLSRQGIMSAEPQRALRSDAADAPNKGNVRRRNQQDRRRAFPSGNSSRLRCCLDRSRLAGRIRIFPAYMFRPGTLQRRVGNSALSSCTFGVTGSPSSAELALAGVSHLRRNESRNAARVARSVGIGGAAGLGSIVYALSVMSEWLHDEDLLADAHAAAELFTDDLIKSDKQLDIIGGSAGAISACFVFIAIPNPTRC